MHPCIYYWFTAISRPFCCVLKVVNSHVSLCLYLQLHPNAVVGMAGGWLDYLGEMTNITAVGYKVVLSVCWYLDHISYGETWFKVAKIGPHAKCKSHYSHNQYYACDPQDFEETAEQKDLVIGGGAAFWGEFVDSTCYLDFGK